MPVSASTAHAHRGDWELQDQEVNSLGMPSESPIAERDLSSLVKLGRNLLMQSNINDLWTCVMIVVSTI